MLMSLVCCLPEVINADDLWSVVYQRLIIADYLWSVVCN